MTDIAKLKAAAEKATPGPWRLTVTRFNGITRGPFSLTKEDALANAAEKVDAEFIAAVNPAAVLQLIAALEAAEKRIAELESRKVKLPSLNPQMFNDDVMFGYRKAQKEAVEFCAAAGITLETGE